MDNTKTSGLAINNEAIVKIAGIAALEVDGVAGLGKRPKQLRNFKSLMSGTRTDHTKSVILAVEGGLISVDVFVTVNDGVMVKDVAEAVQNNIKDKIQSMTGNRVAAVNVHVEDLILEENK